MAKAAAVPEGEWFCPMCVSGTQEPAPVMSERQRILKQADCGTCGNCLDKPKFGGPGTKKKPCKLKQLQLAMLVDRGRGDEPKAKRPKTSVSSARSAVVNIKVYHSPNLRNL